MAALLLVIGSINLTKGKNSSGMDIYIATVNYTDLMARPNSITVQ